MGVNQFRNTTNCAKRCKPEQSGGVGNSLLSTGAVDWNRDKQPEKTLFQLRNAEIDTRRERPEYDPECLLAKRNGHSDRTDQDLQIVLQQSNSG
mmetsp:Transcript_49682/g.149633  ORF Transcript_49682/g.149633 Transcript_49682/m.149633 type:complete len:94 (+) Transcript_49682:154-435(+)